MNLCVSESDEPQTTYNISINKNLAAVQQSLRRIAFTCNRQMPSYIMRVFFYGICFVIVLTYFNTLYLKQEDVIFLNHL